VTGSPVLKFLLFWGTVLSAVASANGCINDGRGRALVLTWPGPVSAHLVLGRASEVPHAVSVDPVPDGRSRWPLRSIADLNQAITFSILSGVLHYTFHEHQTS